MARTLLQIVQDACKDAGQPRPSVVVSASSETPLRMLRLLNKAGKQLIKDHHWNALLDVESFTAVATQAQTHPHPPSDFDRFTPQTSLWDVSLKRPVAGPMATSKWLQLITDTTNGMDKFWTMISGQINIYPVPTTSDSFTYAYQSKNWVADSSSAPKSSFTADDDTPRIDDELLVLELVWRWKASIGIDYAEDLASAARYKETVIAADRGPAIINLSTPRIDLPDNMWPRVIT